MAERFTRVWNDNEEFNMPERLTRRQRTNQRSSHNDE